jgi:hypothetical protein
MNKEMIKQASAIYRETATVAEGSANVKADAFERVINDVVKLEGGMETVRRVDNARTVANAGAIHAAGELALEAFKSKGTEQFTLSTDQGGNSMDIHVTASKLVKLNFAKDGEPTEKTIHGSTQIVYRTVDSSNRGDIAAARDAVKELFAAAITSKS